MKPMLHEACEDCRYHVMPGHHDVGVIEYCDMSGLKVVCQDCDYEEEFKTPDNPFDRPAFIEIVQELVSMHSSEELYTGHHEDNIVKLTLFQRIYGAFQIFRTKYIHVDD